MRRISTAALATTALLAGALSMARHSQASPLKPADDPQPRLVVFEFFSKLN